MIRNLLAAILVLSVLFSFGASAETVIQDQTFPDEITVDGQKLVLNGAGIRVFRKFGIPFKVYVGGLYLKEKTSDVNKIVNSEDIRVIKSFYLRSVTKKDQEKPWIDHMKASCKFDCKMTNDRMRAFASKLVRTKKGGKFDFIFYKDKVRYEIEGKNESIEGELEGAAFSKDLMLAYIGEKPPTKELKNALLGIKEK